MSELEWVRIAREFIGLKENTSIDVHHPAILTMLDAMGEFSNEAEAWWHEDETPWCGLFIGYCLGKAGRFVVKEWYRAREWESEFLTKINAPAYGCLVTFTRSGGGHVGFVVGKDSAGNLMVLGGNQLNEVSIKPFSVDRVTGYFWPSYWENSQPVKSVPYAHRYELPILNSTGSELSENEA